MLLKAASIADEAFIHLLEDIKPGCTERSLAGVWNTICVPWEVKRLPSIRL